MVDRTIEPDEEAVAATLDPRLVGRLRLDDTQRLRMGGNRQDTSALVRRLTRA